uniref:Gustatory receptor n=1 Tax=Anopheles farauti TaxID=69004 RepID=A0A182QTE6_9DIPT
MVRQFPGAALAVPQNMHVFDNLRVLLSFSQIMGLLAIKQPIARSDSAALFGTTSHVGLKFTIFFLATLLGCAVVMFQAIVENFVNSIKETGSITGMVYVVHNVIFCVVFFVLPWQTYRHRYRLAAAMNTLHQNELDLVRLTGNRTDYRLVRLLATVIVANGVILHVFFNSYYIVRYHSFDNFFAIYASRCFYMYFDLGMELILGVCDCILLIARLQLERLVEMTKHRDPSTETDRFVELYVDLYGKIVRTIRFELSPYFGPIVSAFGAYMCLEVAVCSLDANSMMWSHDRSIMALLANIMWPVSDIKKISALLVLSEGVNAMYAVMNVFGNIQAILRVLRVLGLLALQRSSGTSNGTGSYESDHYAALKFIIMFGAAVLGSGYSILYGVVDLPQMFLSGNMSFYPFVYIAHAITQCVVLCQLPWQTFRRRRQLVSLMNILNQNELHLVELTGRGTNYRTVRLLSIVSLCNGIVFHTFFHFYYVYEFITYKAEFVSLYIVGWMFMYLDLATEYLLGFCDCLLLIAQLQLERVAQLARDHIVAPEHRIQLHVTVYDRTVRALEHNLSPYFGPIVAVFCTYASLEAAICIMAIVGATGGFKGRPELYVLANVLWLLTDMKKLVAVFLLSERTSAMSYLSHMRKLGITPIRYDRRRGVYGKLPWYQFTIQCVCSVACITYTMFRLTRDYQSLVKDVNMLNQVANIITTVAFCIVWSVVPTQVYRKRAQLTSALNCLLQNDADLRRVTGSVCGSVSYSKTETFGRMIQLDGVLCFLLLGVGYMLGYGSSEGSTPHQLFLTIGVYLYEDLCLSLFFGFIGTLFHLCAEQLANAGQLLETLDMLDDRSLVQRVESFCAVYDRICITVTDALYDYSGPLFATFCPMIIVQVSLRLFFLEEIVEIGDLKQWSTRFLIMMDVLEWLWLCFDCKKLVILLHVSDILHRQVSPMDYIVYKLESMVFDLSIFVIITTVSCALCLIIPLQTYCKRTELAATLNALLTNDLHPAEGRKTSPLRRGDTIRPSPCWPSDNIKHILLSISIYLVLDMWLEWIFGLCCVVMLIGIAQLASATELLLRNTKDPPASRASPVERAVPSFVSVYNRVSIDVRKGLSVYCGLIVVLFISMLVLQCAVKMVDIWNAFSASDTVASFRDLIVLALELLWLLADCKKLVIFMLLSESLKRKVRNDRSTCPIHSTV